MATDKPSTAVNLIPKLSTREIKPEPLSVELFNRATSDLDDKGIINLKQYSKYLNKNQDPSKN